MDLRLAAPGPVSCRAEAGDLRRDKPLEGVGSLSNPGSGVWEDVVRDYHDYPRVPHTAETIQRLRTLDGIVSPCSSPNMGSVARWTCGARCGILSSRGAGRLEDASSSPTSSARFEADWRDWHLEEAFARPEDFFMESLKKMAGQRTLGLNAIRANPNIISHTSRVRSTT